jgi:endoribonuclease LACTB2
MITVYEKEGITCIEGHVERNGRNAGKVFAFLTDRMLIDTGAKLLESELITFYENNPFDLVTLTHCHEDHTGTASWIQEHKKVPIYIHEKGIHSCAHPCPYPKYRQIAWGIRREFKAMPIGDTVHSKTQEWKVIYTPGHADDHISLLHEESGRLFTGDLFLAPKTKLILEFESIPVIMNSIRLLLSYDFGPIFCSHAGYIKNGKEMMTQKLDNLENLCGEVLNLYHKGHSISEIKKNLFPYKYPIEDISEGEFDSLHIINSIISDKNLITNW